VTVPPGVTRTFEPPMFVSSPVGGHDDLSLALALLRQAVAIVDHLWNEARSAPGGPGLVMALGEASQGVHRALSALVPDPAPQAASSIRPPPRSGFSTG